MLLSFSRYHATKSENSLGNQGGSIFTVLLATLKQLDMIAERFVGSGDPCSSGVVCFLAPEPLTQSPLGGCRWPDSAKYVVQTNK